MLHLGFGVVHRRRDVGGDHLGEAVEVAEESRADQPEEGPDVEPRLRLGQLDVELVAEPGQAEVDVADNLGKQLVDRLQDELDEAPLCRRVRGLRCEPEVEKVEDETKKSCKLKRA